MTTKEQKTLSENLNEFLYLGVKFDQLMAQKPDKSDEAWWDEIAKVVDRRQELLLEMTKDLNKD